MIQRSPYSFVWDDTARPFLWGQAEPASVTTRQYVIYDATGGTVTVPVGNGTYTQFWFNPRTGGALISKPNLVVTTGSATFAFGGFNDWVAWLKKI